MKTATSDAHSPLWVYLTQRVDRVPGRDEVREGIDVEWRLLIREALGSQACPLVLPNDLTTVGQLLRAAPPSLIVLTGGNDIATLPEATNVSMERDHVESMLLDISTENTIPVLGVCRGMQMMIHHLGGSLTRVNGHVGATHPLMSSSDGRREIIGANSFHSWGVDATSLDECWYSRHVHADGTVESIRNSTYPWVGVMWHPERPDGSNVAHTEWVVKELQLLCGVEK